MARLTFQSQNLLLGSLGSFSENWLGLTTVTAKFHMVPPLAQSFGVTFASFVLSNFVLGVSFAAFVLAECTSYFRDVNHLSYWEIRRVILA